MLSSIIFVFKFISTLISAFQKCSNISGFAVWAKRKRTCQVPGHSKTSSHGSRIASATTTKGGGSGFFLGLGSARKPRRRNTRWMEGGSNLRLEICSYIVHNANLISIFEIDSYLIVYYTLNNNNFVYILKILQQAQVKKILIPLIEAAKSGRKKGLQPTPSASVSSARTSRDGSSKKVIISLNSEHDCTY